MELLLIPVPLFDKYMSVEAYLLRYSLPDRPENSGKPSRLLLLRALEQGGIKAFAGGNRLFVPFTADLLPELVSSFCEAPDVTTLMLTAEPPFSLSNADLQALLTLKKRGYSIGVVQMDKFVDDEKLIKMCDYVLFDQEAMSGADRRAHVLRYKRIRKNIQAIATDLQTAEGFDRASKDSFSYFEGPFYRIPVSRKDRELSPIKSNLVYLLNVVRDENFSFREVSDVVRQDPALSYSLMRFINSPYLGVKHKIKSIQQAVALLGQIEVRKWVTAAVFKSLGSDRPSELIRISLVRAKFCEDLAALFECKNEATSLFMTGLFSTLDAMLDSSMEEALSKVLVTDEVADALIRSEGPYSPILEFVKIYECAEWENVHAFCKKRAIAISNIYEAYINTVGWYHELISTYAPSLKSPRGLNTPSRPML